jgi:hypothetical protein
LLQGVVQLNLRGLQGGHEAEAETGQQRERQGETQHSAVDGDFGGPG